MFNRLHYRIDVERNLKVNELKIAADWKMEFIDIKYLKLCVKASRNLNGK